MDNLKIFDPTITAKEEKIDFVPRPKSLRDLRIGLVDNTKFNSDKLLIKIAAILEKDYGAKNYINRRKNKSGVPVHEEVINEFVSDCDVVIAGIGD
ncbi:hypothetical protein ACFL0M_09360 [Thermodesulfobacteriota bacterium]